jgi:MoaA/NifB/PqqE/SkfB family radical SAM enzyme
MDLLGGGMSLADYYAALKFRFNRNPSHLILFVTAGCNARCKHCFYWQEIEGAPQGNELSLDEICRISTNMGHVKFLSITGGEPSLRNDLPDIIAAFCRNNQTHNVVLHTNGLLTDKIHDSVVRAAAANPKVEINVSVSIDAMAEQHDLIRGVPGIFTKAIATLDALNQAKQRHPNINVTVNSCYNAYNRNEVRRLSGYLFEHHAIDGYYLSWVRGETLDRESKDVDVRDYLEEISLLQRKSVISRYYRNYPLASLRRTLDFLAPQVVAETVLNGKMPYPCMAGRSVIVISERGEVKPCEMLKESFGNVRDHDYDVNKMLSTPESAAIKRNIADGKCCCTWECAVMNNLVFNWKAYPRVIKTWFVLEFEKRFGR